MKVVKCENYIPEEIWGKVIDNDQCFVEDSEGYLYLVVENEAFPLPEVGDKVYVSEDGKFSGAEFEYRGTVDDQHVCRDEDGDLYLFRYVKPVELENHQSIPVPAPSWCRKEWVSIDKEILYEILHLWWNGIRTTGCCSGHGIKEGYIGVWEEDIEKMLKMGYEIAPNSTDKSRNDSFSPISCRFKKHTND